MKEAGIGGVFVHPRPGLLTEYLSDEWFHLFDYTVQKGKDLEVVLKKSGNKFTDIIGYTALTPGTMHLKKFLQPLTII